MGLSGIVVKTYPSLSYSLFSFLDKSTTPQKNSEASVFSRSSMPSNLILFNAVGIVRPLLNLKIIIFDMLNKFCLEKHCREFD